MTFASRLAPAISLVALLLAGTAHADTRASATVSAEGGYGSNPFFDSAQGQDTATVILRAAPTVSLVGPTSKIDLTGTLEQAFFTSRYNDITNWSLGGRAGVKLSPRSNFSIGARYSSAVSSGLNSEIVPSAPPEDQQPVPPPPDPSATEVGGSRTKNLSGDANFSTQISVRDSISLGGNVAKTDYAFSNASSFTTYGGSVGFTHIFSDTFSGGLNVGYSKTDYEGAGGSFDQISPGVHASLKIAPRFSLNGGFGATFNHQTFGGFTDNKAFFSGNVSLCRLGDRGNFCLFGSRSVGATAQGGSSIITALGGNYSYRLTPRSSISVSGNYSKTKRTSFFSSADTGYASGSISYEHQLKERLFFRANARYTDPFESIGFRRKSFYGGVGVTYRFGR